MLNIVRKIIGIFVLSLVANYSFAMELDEEKSVEYYQKELDNYDEYDFDYKESEFKKFSNFCNALANNESIEELTIIQCHLDLNAIKTLVQSLKTNKTLKFLDLRDNSIDSIKATALAEIFVENKSLKKINLAYNIIDDIGVKALSQTLKLNETLNRIYLNYNSIGNDGAKALAEMLEKNASIKEIDLTHNNISDIGAKYLADAIENNSSIRTLNLMNYAELINPEILMKITEYLNRNSELRSLSDSDNLSATSHNLEAIQLISTYNFYENPRLLNIQRVNLFNYFLNNRVNDNILSPNQYKNLAAEVLNFVEDGDNLKCPICLSKIKDVIDTNEIEQIKCQEQGHIFCKKCIEENYKYQQECPICKNKF
jgi:Ran GTPase-activating protein (RanGAP) involved in mRNA processing and transport